MFEEWGFLLLEIWMLLACAAVGGLFAGWLIWGGKSPDNEGPAIKAVTQTDIEAAERKLSEKDKRIGELLAALEAAQGQAEPITVPTAPPARMPAVKAVDTAEPAEKGSRPAGLDAPRNGFGDDLTMIKGIGPKMEKLCNSFGFYHFDQIAAWGDDEVAWVDANLEGFRGRVSRDKWVVQAKELSPNRTVAFSRSKPD